MSAASVAGMSVAPTGRMAAAMVAALLVVAIHLRVAEPAGHRESYTGGNLGLRGPVIAVVAEANNRIPGRSVAPGAGMSVAVAIEPKAPGVSCTGTAVRLLRQEALGWEVLGYLVVEVLGRSLRR
jgi:hypothetical protein